MRRLAVRSELGKRLTDRLLKETQDIEALDDEEQMKARAAQRYAAARRAVWFRPAIDALRTLSGPGERCMCCSGSESAQLEHYRDKDHFPKLALTWTNFLWLCGICNLAKGNRFNSIVPPVNPLEENVWDFFFLDEYGNLCPRWDPVMNALNARAVATISLYKLDRQALQETRLARQRELKASTEDWLRLIGVNLLTADEVQEKLLEIHSSPLQPDVADYFWNGPGSTETPFRELLVAVGL